jgi:hypothetical protein
MLPVTPETMRTIFSVFRCYYRVVSEMLNYATLTTLLRVGPVATAPGSVVGSSIKETSVKAELAAGHFAESSRSFRNPRKNRVPRA